MKSNEVTQTSHLRFSIDRGAKKTKFSTFTHTHTSHHFCSILLLSCTTLITRGKMIISVHINVNEMNVIFVVKNEAAAATAKKQTEWRNIVKKKERNIQK